MARPTQQSDATDLVAQVLDFMFQHRQLFGTILGVAAYEYLKRRRRDVQRQRRESEVLDELSDLQEEIRRLRDEVRERHLAATRPVVPVVDVGPGADSRADTTDRGTD